MDHIQEIISRFFTKEASQSELSQLENWMNERENRQTLVDYLKIWLWAAQVPAKQPEVDLEDTWKLIRRQQTRENVASLRILLFLRYAAIVFLVLNVGWWGSRLFYRNHDQQAEQQFRVYADHFNNSKIVLPDETVVFLRPGTSLEYDSQFNQKSRNVSLDGEAYFEVARNESLPFSVMTSHARIDVLGTSFHVLAKKESAVMQTTLVEGEVEFITSHGEKFLLNPDQMLTLNVETNEVNVSSVKADLITSWKDGKLIFRDETLGEITRKLEEIYHVKFIYKNAELAEQYKFSGTFPHSTPVRDIIRMLKISIPMKVKHEDRFPDQDIIFLE